MFDFTSRYYKLSTSIFVSGDGKQISYKQRRFLPQGEQLPLLQEFTVTQDDRLDLISATTLGNAEYYWRLADANNTMNPSELTEDIGRVLRVPVPQAE